MPPIVLVEILSDANLPKPIASSLSGIPLIDIPDGYWERVGALRAKVLEEGRKARLGDALIAQSCIDRGIALITRDSDFRAFSQVAGLDLAIG